MAEAPTKNQAARVRAKLQTIKRDQKAFDHWEQDAKRITRRYRGESQDALTPTDDKENRYNIFWSNLQTLLPSLYARTPVPQAERRFKDKDELARIAAEIIERATRFQLEDHDFDAAVSAAVLDLCLLGRGVCRVRYVPKFEGEQKVEENVYAEYVYWKDFSHSSARSWDEVQEVRFRIYLTRADAEAQLGKEIADKLIYKYCGVGLEEEENSKQVEGGDSWKKAQIWEVWNKKSKTVCWLSEDVPDIYLREIQDPLQLKGFFPMPKPLYGSLTNDSLVPVPDFKQYSALANLLDKTIAREQALVEDLRVAGVYDAACDDIQRLLETGGNRLIPVKNWAAFGSQGGFDGAVQFWPITQVVEALQVIHAEKEQIKNDIYEVTGWADIMRGASDPNETAAAQQIKGRFASIRLTRRQMDVQRFVKDLVALTAEIQSELFEPSTFLAMTGDEFIPEPQIPPQVDPATGQPIPQDPQMVAQLVAQQKQKIYLAAVELLRNDPMRRFKIDIETDSTLAIDDALDQQKRSDFMQSITGFLQVMGKLGQELPSYVPAMGEMLLFVARTYKAGRNLESELENAIEETKAQLEAAKNAPPPPDPKQQELEAKIQLETMKAQSAQQTAALKADLEAKLANLEHAAAIRELEFKMIVDAKKEEAQAKADMAIEAIRAQVQALEAKASAPAKGSGSGLRVNVARNKRRVVALPPDGTGAKRFQIEDIIEELAPGTVGLDAAPPKNITAHKADGQGGHVFSIDEGEVS